MLHTKSANELPWWAIHKPIAQNVAVWLYGWVHAKNLQCLQLKLLQRLPVATFCCNFLSRLFVTTFYSVFLRCGLPLQNATASCHFELSLGVATIGGRCLLPCLVAAVVHSCELSLRVAAAVFLSQRLSSCCNFAPIATSFLLWLPSHCDSPTVASSFLL